MIVAVLLEIRVATAAIRLVASTTLPTTGGVDTVVTVVVLDSDSSDIHTPCD
jgi:uncharacterized ferredoxin-like protein